MSIESPQMTRNPTLQRSTNRPQHTPHQKPAARAKSPWRTTGSAPSPNDPRAVLRPRADAIARFLRLSHPLIPSNAEPAFAPTAQARVGWHPRLFDHETFLRLHGARGPSGLPNSIVIAEPYISTAEIPAALGVWAAKLAPLGLGVRQLPRALLIHAPDNDRSHIFAVGAHHFLSNVP